MDRARLVALLCAVAGAGGVAAAHVEQYPKRDRLELRPTGVRLVIDYAVPPGEDARTLRKIFDRDHSGALDADEYAALGKALGDEARRFLSLTVDGQAVSFRAETHPGPAGQGNERLVVELSLEANVAVHGKLILEDRHKDRRILVPVTVVTQGVKLASLPSLVTVSTGHPLELAVE